MKWNKANAAISAALICAVVVWSLITVNKRPQAALIYSEFLARVRAGQVASVIIEPGGDATPAICTLKDGATVRTVLPRDYYEALAAMQDNLLKIEIRETSSGWLPLLVNASPFILLLAFWIFMMRQMGKATPAK